MGNQKKGTVLEEKCLSFSGDKKDNQDGHLRKISAG
jgi:hypothetical protein